MKEQKERKETDRVAIFPAPPVSSPRSQFGLFFLLLPLLLFLPSPSFAANSQAGTSGAQFLEISPGARPVAMGQAFSGLADDVNAVYYNPAGLANITGVQVTGMEDQYFQSINYGFAAIETPLLSWGGGLPDQPKNAYGVAAAAVYNLSIPNLQSRGTTETLAPLGTFNSEDFAYALSYAYAFKDTGLSLGATGKFITSNLDGYHASGFAADAGALYRRNKISLGLGVRNLGPEYGFAGASDPLPRIWYLGAGYQVTDRWALTAETDLPRDNNLSYGFGTEYTYPFTQKLHGSARLGYNSQNTDPSGFTGPSFGAGIGWGSFDFDFAFLPFGELGNTYLYSLVVKF